MEMYKQTPPFQVEKLGWVKCHCIKEELSVLLAKSISNEVSCTLFTCTYYCGVLFK